MIRAINCLRLRRLICWICSVPFLLLSSCSDSEDYLRVPALGGVIRDFQEYTDLPGYPIHRPVSIAVDSPYVFVADQGLNAIIQLDWELQAIRRIGREGKGPGEFSSLADISVRNRVLVAVDGGQGNRVVIFDYDGSLINQFNLDTRISEPEVALSPSGTVWVEKYRYNPAVNKTYTGSAGIPDTMLTEYSLDGLQLGRLDWRPDVKTSTQAVCELCVYEDGLFMAFKHWPRLTMLGAVGFDRFYRLEEGFPVIRPAWERVFENMKAPVVRGGSAISMFGGYSRLGNAMILAGPLYNLAVVDLQSGTLRPVSLGQYGVDLINAAGHSTWDALSILGDRVILASMEAGRILVLKLSDVLAASREGIELKPIPSRPEGY